MVEATTENLFLIYGGFFFAVVLFSLLINAIMLRFAHTLGIRDKEGTVIRWSSVSKPSLGGFSFYISFLLSIATFSAFFNDVNIFRTPYALGLIGATSISFLMGLADDAYDTRPLLKLFIQVLCAGLLITTGNYIMFFEADWINYLLTIIWVVAIMNSINMLDNMDAITGVVSITILISMLAYLIITEQTMAFEAFLIIGVVASLIGFLFYNWHPAKMFMGDTGSQFLGIILAGLGIHLLWNAEGVDGELFHSRQFALVMTTFSLPIIDTTCVVINRIRRGQSPFVGGKDHTTHNLSYLGFTDSQVAMIFAGISMVNLFLCIVILNFIEVWEAWHLYVFIAYFLTMLFTFYSITRKKEREVLSKSKKENE